MYGRITFYPALFRIAIGILLLIDVGSSLFYIEDLYQIPGYVHQWDAFLPWLDIIRSNAGIFLTLYMIFLTLWLLGLGKHMISFIIFIFYVIDFLILFPATFWGDYILRMTLFYFVFVDSFNFFSIKKDSSATGLIHRLAILSIMLHLSLIYIENAYYKLGNAEWIDGYALAYFFKFSRILDIFNIGDLMLNYSNAIRFSSWFVLLFQITFPFALWIKKLKIWWIVIGILIHLLMAVTLQLYKFELIMILLYGFFINDAEWQRLFDRLNIKLDIIHGKR